MALIGEMHYLTIGENTYSIPTSGGSTVTIQRALTSGTKSATISVDGTSYDLYAPTPNAGTVTSVRVQATSPVQSSTSTAQSSSLNTTISLANGYGDTKNPYGTKTANHVLAGPSSGSAAAPSFRTLVAADIPDLSGTYLTSHLTGSGAISVENNAIALKLLETDTSTQQNIIFISHSTYNNISGIYIVADDGSVDGNYIFIPDLAGINTASQQIISSIPTKVSQLTNDSGFITNYTETDPTVPSWAKASTKPTYTASEVGAYTTSEVDALIEGLPEPMIFKGSLGTGGTITSLPTAATSNEGHTYKVITAGTYGSQGAKVGDTFISDGSTWVLIPSGDEPSGTVTSVTLNSGTGISVSNGGIAITTSGSRTISLATITKDDTTSTASPSHGGTFTAIDSITYDTYGRVTGVNTKTITLPADSNTDTKVTQAYSTANNSYPILFSATAGVSSTSSRGATTAILNNAIYANPSTGNLHVTQLNGVTVGTSPKFTDTTYTNVSEFTNDAGYITSADVPEGASAYTGTISAVGTSASAGTNNGFARGDHVHNITKTTIDGVLGTGSGTTKFYREDGSWATPAYTTNTDTKVSTAAVTSGTTYYPVVGSDTTSAATKFYDKTGITYTGTNGTTSAVGSARLVLGNSTASGSANNKQGILRLYSTSTGYGDLVQNAVSSSVSVTHTFQAKSGTVAHTSDIPSIPTSTENATTGITASTTATKTTLGTASSIYGVGSTTTIASKASGGNGTAPSWVFEEVSIPNVTAAGSASTWTFEEKTIPNVTAAGSASTWTFGATTVGDGTLVGTVDSSDSSMLVITAGTKSVQQKTGGGNGTAPTLGTAIKVQSKSGGSNGTAPTIGTAIKVQSKKSGSNGSASTWSFTDVTVPIKDSSATSVPNVSVASATVSITDPGHAHTI